MTTIKQILAAKTKPVATVGPNDTAKSAIDLMCKQDIGAVLVVDNGKLVGIFTERDSMRKITACEANPCTTLVRSIMSDKVRYVTADVEISQALNLMTERFFRHLPVLDEQQNILGIVSIGDLVKAKLSEQTFLLEQMERYITS